MNKLFLRIVSTALVISLIADPSLAAISTSRTFPASALPDLSVFHEQALTAEPLGEQPQGGKFILFKNRSNRVSVISDIESSRQAPSPDSVLPDYLNITSQMPNAVPVATIDSGIRVQLHQDLEPLRPAIQSLLKSFDLAGLYRIALGQQTSIDDSAVGELNITLSHRAYLRGESSLLQELAVVLERLQDVRWPRPVGSPHIDLEPVLKAPIQNLRSALRVLIKKHQPREIEKALRELHQMSKGLTTAVLHSTNASLPEETEPTFEEIIEAYQKSFEYPDGPDSPRFWIFATDNLIYELNETVFLPLGWYVYFNPDSAQLLLKQANAWELVNYRDTTLNFIDIRDESHSIIPPDSVAQRLPGYTIVDSNTLKSKSAYPISPSKIGGIESSWAPIKRIEKLDAGQRFELEKRTLRKQVRLWLMDDIYTPSAPHVSIKENILRILNPEGREHPLIDQVAEQLLDAYNLNQLTLDELETASAYAHLDIDHLMRAPSPTDQQYFLLKRIATYRRDQTDNYPLDDYPKHFAHILVLRSAAYFMASPKDSFGFIQDWVPLYTQLMNSDPQTTWTRLSLPPLRSISTVAEPIISKLPDHYEILSENHSHSVNQLKPPKPPHRHPRKVLPPAQEPNERKAWIQAATIAAGITLLAVLYNFSHYAEAYRMGNALIGMLSQKAHDLVSLVMYKTWLHRWFPSASIMGTRAFWYVHGLFVPAVELWIAAQLWKRASTKPTALRGAFFGSTFVIVLAAYARPIIDAIQILRGHPIQYALERGLIVLFHFAAHTEAGMTDSWIYLHTGSALGLLFAAVAFSGFIYHLDTILKYVSRKLWDVFNRPAAPTLEPEKESPVPQVSEPIQVDEQQKEPIQTQEEIRQQQRARDLARNRQLREEAELAASEALAKEQQRKDFLDRLEAKLAEVKIRRINQEHEAARKLLDEMKALVTLAQERNALDKDTLIPWGAEIGRQQVGLRAEIQKHDKAIQAARAKVIARDWAGIKNSLANIHGEAADAVRHAAAAGREEDQERERLHALNKAQRRAEELAAVAEREAEATRLAAEKRLAREEREHALFNLAQKAYDQGRYRAALWLLTQINLLTLDTLYQNAQTMLARQKAIFEKARGAYDQGRYRYALKLADQAQDIPETRGLRAEAANLLQARRTARLQAFQDRWTGRHNQLSTWETRLLATAAGSIAVRLQNDHQKLEKLETSLEASRSQLQQRNATADAINAASQLLEARKWDKARAAYDKALNGVGPSDVRSRLTIYYGMLECAYGLDNLARAEDVIDLAKSVVQAHPELNLEERWSVFIVRAGILRARGKSQAAREQLTELNNEVKNIPPEVAKTLDMAEWNQKISDERQELAGSYAGGTTAFVDEAQALLASGQFASVEEILLNIPGEKAERLRTMAQIQLKIANKPTSEKIQALLADFARWLETYFPSIPTNKKKLFNVRPMVWLTNYAAHIQLHQDRIVEATKTDDTLRSEALIWFNTLADVAATAKQDTESQIFREIAKEVQPESGGASPMAETNNPTQERHRSYLHVQDATMDPLYRDVRRYRPNPPVKNPRPDLRWSEGADVYHPEYGIGEIVDYREKPIIRFPGRPDAVYNRSAVTPVLLLPHMAAKLSTDRPLSLAIVNAVDNGSIRPYVSKNPSRNIPDHVFLYDSGPQILEALKPNRNGKTAFPPKNLHAHLQQHLKTYAYQDIADISDLPKHIVVTYSYHKRISEDDKIKLEQGLKKLDHTSRPYRRYQFTTEDIAELEDRLQEVPGVSADFRGALADVLQGAKAAGYTYSRISLVSEVSQPTAQTIVEGAFPQRPNAEKLLIGLKTLSLQPKTPGRVSQRDRALGKLRYLQEDVDTIEELADFLKKQIKTLRGWIKMKRLRPAQTIADRPGHNYHFFLKKKRDSILRELAPDQLPDAYTLIGLAKAVRSDDKTVFKAIQGELNGGGFRPKEILGTATRPIYIVPADDLEHLYKLVHPETESIDFSTAAELLGTTRPTLAIIMKLNKMPIQSWKTDSRTYRRINLIDFDTLKEQMDIPSYMVSRSKAARRLRTTRSQLDRVPVDRISMYGKKPTYFIDSRSFPRRISKKSVQNWIDNRLKKAFGSGSPRLAFLTVLFSLGSILSNPHIVTLATLGFMTHILYALLNKMNALDRHRDLATAS